MNNRIIFCLFLLFAFHITIGQNSMVEGYVYESNNRGFLNLVEILIQDESGKQYPRVYSNIDGTFRIALPKNLNYLIRAKKDLFVDQELKLSISDETKSFVKIEMQRKPGYIFDMTIAQSRKNEIQPVDAIMDADIEIYNNTTQKEEVTWLNHHEPHFKYTFEKGNHYTLLIRKDGYVAKQVEIYVNVNGCILCVDGLGELRPGVTDNLTAGNEMGTLLANIVMDSVNLNKTFTFKNIYYDYNKWDITPRAAKELNKVSALMKSNPQLILELGSHTDARGKDDYNMELSEKRAAAAVDYIIKNGEIERSKLQSKGYGESTILNHCKNGINCTDTEHGTNRRTELKVLAILTKDQYNRKSLAELKKEEQTENLIKSLQNQQAYSIKDNSPVTNSFSGISIELMIVEKELISTHEIYKLYKPILYRELPNGKHGYYCGTFNTAMDATDYINRMKIKSKYPKARLIQFQDGLPRE